MPAVPTAPRSGASPASNVGQVRGPRVNRRCRRASPAARTQSEQVSEQWRRVRDGGRAPPRAAERAVVCCRGNRSDGPAPARPRSWAAPGPPAVPHPGLPSRCARRDRWPRCCGRLMEDTAARSDRAGGPRCYTACEEIVDAREWPVAVHEPRMLIDNPGSAPCTATRVLPRSAVTDGLTAPGLSVASAVAARRPQFGAQMVGKHDRRAPLSRHLRAQPCCQRGSRLAGRELPC